MGLTEQQIKAIRADLINGNRLTPTEAIALCDAALRGLGAGGGSAAVKTTAIKPFPTRFGGDDCDPETRGASPQPAQGSEGGGR